MKITKKYLQRIIKDELIKEFTNEPDPGAKRDDDEDEEEIEEGLKLAGPKFPAIGSAVTDLGPVISVLARMEKLLKANHHYLRKLRR